MPAEQDRIATLRQAAAAKRDAAAARAETGIRALAKTGQPITFRAVAAAGGVSVDFLYRHPELRARIERLRGRRHKRRQPYPPRNVSAGILKMADLVDEIALTRAQRALVQGEHMV